MSADDGCNAVRCAWCGVLRGSGIFGSEAAVGKTVACKACGEPNRMLAYREMADICDEDFWFRCERVAA